MSIFEAVVSGIIQGLTEFLPVSSSGHLVLAHSFFGSKEPEVFFDICLHFATMASILIFFRREVILLFTPEGRNWRKYIAIGTIPAVLAGLILEKDVTRFFADPRAVSGMLLFTAAALIPAQMAFSKKNSTDLEIGNGRAFIIGLAQAVAIIPGLSRSGLTISAGLSSGISPEKSFRFSFLLSIPIIAGATLYKTAGVLFLGKEGGTLSAPVFISGMAFAFVSGLAGLFFVRKAMIFRKIWIFSVYCFLLGTVGLIILK
ncbi:MAG: undecaprenyl-diphosphate phosphatase [Candidatus Omnitrophota bacterium]